MTGKWWNQNVNTDHLAPEILQVFAVGASTSGMFQKASVPGPVGVKEAHLMALQKASNVSPVSGFVFSPSGKSGRQPTGLSVGAIHPSCVFTALQCSLPSRASYAALGCQDQPHM